MNFLVEMDAGTIQNEIRRLQLCFARSEAEVYIQL
jgi:hypothetical protein